MAPKAAVRLMATRGRFQKWVSPHRLSRLFTTAVWWVGILQKIKVSDLANLLHVPQINPKIKLNKKNPKNWVIGILMLADRSFFLAHIPKHPSFILIFILLHLLRRLVDFRKDFDTMETETELLDELQHPGKRTWGWSEHMSNSVQSVSARTQDARPYTAFPRFLGKQSKSFWWNIDLWWCKIVQF